ncbi:hypothetical protein GWN91_06515, partial [Candidatus Saccharibacteria bacterium]|nr:hypothetical protein [Candidatus Saccharibacteria bacterium]NIW80228.1 hypothetical protein [Calditrichia bacterium]
MTRAKHSRWAHLIFDIYLWWAFRRHFNAFHLLGELPKPDPKLPLILVPNHSTWWDGFFVHFLNKRYLGRPLYLMMLEEQLQKYKFFSRVGAYGIEPDNSKSILKSLNYTTKVLKQSQSPFPTVCIFPQGELQPWGKRPLDFKSGIDWVIKKYQKPINILLLCIRCEYLQQQKPGVFFLFNKNYVFDVDTFPGNKWLEEIEEVLLDDLNQRIAEGKTGQLLLNGSRSVNQKMDRVLGRG